MMNLPLPNNRLKLGTAGWNKLKPATNPPSSDLMQVSLSEFLQPMMAAIKQSQPWVNDFENDQIMLPVDLYEVIKEFARLQTKKPS